MKTSRFLSLLAIFALALTFFACSGDGDSPSEQQGGEPLSSAGEPPNVEPSSDSPNGEPPIGEPSSSSGDVAKLLCGNVEYDANIYRCESGELIGKCKGADFYPAYQVCNNGVIEDNAGSEPSSSPSISSSSVPSSSSAKSSSSISSASSSSRVCKSNDLGKGYDVIGKPYINWTDVNSSLVLDQDKMCQDGILELDKPGGNQQFAWFSGSTVEELYSKRNESMKISASLGVEVKIPFVFSAGVEAKFAKKTSSGSEQNSSSKYYYSQIRSYLYTGEDQIKSGSASAQNLSKYLTSSFVSDLKSTKSPGQILDLYGSHIFIQYFKGGSLEANYTYTGSNNSSHFTSADQMELAAKLSFKKVDAKASSETSVLNEQMIRELEDNMSFNYETYGGTSLKATNMNKLLEEYGGWVSSINSNARTTGIKDFAQSFIPIWDFAQQVEGVTAARINDLKSEFKRRAEAQGAKFPIEENCTPEDNSNTHYCSNGFLNEYGKVTDDGGKTYKTVVIGTQTWMAENLNYNVTGSKCGGTTSYEETYFSENLGEEFIITYYLLEDRNTLNCDKYGRLYDWVTAMALPSNCYSTLCVSQAKHKGICPSGYHIPTNADWDKLILYVGGKETAGRYLRAAVGWAICGSGSSDAYKCEDKYGFAALPGGSGGDSGRYNNPSINGFWWSSSEFTQSAYEIGMDYRTEGLFGGEIGTSDKSNLNSVRCVKD